MFNTEWQTIHYYQACIEIAERCNLCIEQAGDYMAIKSTEVPYVKGTCLYINDFKSSLCWLQGYAQRILEVKNT